MGTKKFKKRFNKAYRLVVVIGITMSLLGVSYGYWSDEKIIEAKIVTPKIVLKSNINNNLLRRASNGSDIEICKADLKDGGIPHLLEECCEDMRTLLIPVKIQEGTESSIPIKYDNCEIYFIDDVDAPEDEEGITLKDLNPAIYTAKETSEGSYNIEIKLSTFELKSFLDKENISYKANKARLRVVLNFKQDVEAGEEGWEYPVEKTYTIEFMEPKEPDDDQSMQLVGSGATEGNGGSVKIEPQPSGTPDSGSTDSETPDSGTSDSEVPDSGIPDSGALDSGSPDSGSPDSRSPDSGSPDSGSPDSGSSDSGTSE